MNRELRLVSDHDEFYRNLTCRNRHFVSEKVQESLRRLRLLIAGCGSTGGACIESLARLGVEKFVLADNGRYELNNLNRQHATIDDINTNKAEFHARQLKKINPFIEVQVHPEGVTEKNVNLLAANCDLIMDAVDVTTPTGIEMKIRLHEQAKANAKPLLTALDIGFCQWGESYDYRDSSLEVLRGKAPEARAAKHPMKALFSFVPFSAVPPHAVQLVHDLLVKPDTPASQLGGTSDLLSAIIVPTILRFAEYDELVSWNVNLEYLAMPIGRRILDRVRTLGKRSEVKRLLKKVA